ncbi:TrkH family potassium uptake protein [candidate division KSB1 bacterium]|nr:TrkH family potassium uptake protein [candidate division KSB1 bacterium]
MRLNIVLRYAGFVLLINALFLFIAAIISVIYGDQALRPLLYSAIVTALFGIFPLIFVPPAKSISNNEGLVIVVSSWLLSCLVGTLPYILWGGEFNFTNAWFESVSGYTTTGSSILINIEALPSGLLFWRATTHFLGGMGIIIFVLSVLPSMGIAGMVLYRSEMSSLVQESFRQNVRTTLRVLFTVYVGLTIVETIALLLCGMNLFDAITHAFATIATGGFSSKNNSIAYYDSAAIEIVIIIFMVLSGMHFGLLYTTFFTGGKDIFKSTMVRYYLLAIGIGIVLTTINLHGFHYQSWFDALRYAAFQIISVGTSTGFATADSSVWPSLAKILLIFFTLQCACAGSTSGGIKADRLVMFGKAVIRQLKLLQHPRAILAVKIDNRTIQEEVMAQGILFICVYLAIVFIATIFLILLGVDLLSAFSGVVATTGNVGPGLGTVGSAGNFNHIPLLGKWILTGTMLLGRLEIYGLIIFFVPNIWKIRTNR